MENEKKYFAFISYKREDEEWAKWLENKLGHYKLPSNLNGRTDLPKQIRPVFRDKSELAGGVLSEEIQKALEASRFLIVICSPRVTQSTWVNKEVQSFIDMGRADRIIPFIIGGTAYAQDAEKECFPSALLGLPKNQELLGINIEDMGRDAAAVKVVAQMFGLKFGELWRKYERERRRRTFLIVSSIIAFIMLCFVALSYINRQNIVIKESKKQEKISLYKRLVSFSLDAKNKGDFRLASLLLLETIPDDAKDSASVLIETETALNQLVYGSGGSAFSHIASIHSDGLTYCFWGDSDELFATDNNDFILRNIYSGKERKIHHNWTFSNDIVTAVAPKGKYFAVFDPDAHELYIFSGQDFQLLSTFPIYGYRCKLVFNDNDSQLAIIDDSACLHTIDIPSFKESKIVLHDDTNFFLDGIGFYYLDNHCLCIGGTIVNIDTQHQTCFNSGYSEPESSICDDEVYEMFATYNHKADVVVKSYYGDYKQELRAYGNHLNTVTGYDAKTVDVIEKMILTDAVWEGMEVRDIVFSNDDKYLAVTYSNMVKIYECKSACFEELQTIETDYGFLKSARFNPSSNKLLITSFDLENTLVYSLHDRPIEIYSNSINKRETSSKVICLTPEYSWGFYMIDPIEHNYRFCKEANNDFSVASEAETVVTKEKDELVMSDLEGVVVNRIRFQNIESFDISSSGDKMVVLANQKLYYVDAFSGSIIGYIDCYQNTEYDKRRVHFSKNGEWIILQCNLGIQLYSALKDIALYKFIEKASDAEISDNGLLALYWRSYCEYVSVEELNTGLYKFKTKSHLCTYEPVLTSISFNDDGSKLLISDYGGYEIYDTESGLLFDRIICWNRGGYWYGSGIYSIADDSIVYYPMDSFQRKVNFLRDKIEGDSLNVEERMRYGVLRSN